MCRRQSRTLSTKLVKHPPALNNWGVNAGLKRKASKGDITTAAIIVKIKRIPFGKEDWLFVCKAGPFLEKETCNKKSLSFK